MNYKKQRMKFHITQTNDITDQKVIPLTFQKFQAKYQAFSLCCTKNLFTITFSKITCGPIEAVPGEKVNRPCNQSLANKM